MEEIEIDTKKNWLKEHRFFIISVTVLSIILFLFLWFFYQGKITIKIVDAVTGLPLENVNIEYSHDKCTGFSWHSAGCSYTVIDAGKITTDNKGYAKIPAVITPRYFSRLFIKIHKDNYHKIVRGPYMHNKEPSFAKPPNKINLFLMPIVDSFEECKKIKDDSLKLSCINYNLDLLNSTNSHICFDLPSPVIYPSVASIRLKCIYGALDGGYLKESSICEYVYNDYKDIGYGDVIRYDDEGNEEYIDGAIIKKSECLQKLFSSLKDLSYCNLIEDEKSKNNCYYDYAIDHNDFNICERISEESDFKNGCYVRIAVKTGDPGICKYISENQEKEECIGRAEITRNVGGYR